MIHLPSFASLNGRRHLAATLLCLGVLGCGTMQNEAPAPLAPRPVDPAFTRFWSTALSTTTSASGVLEPSGEVRVGAAETHTTVMLRGPQGRLAFGVIEDGELHGVMAHRMQFLLLPDEVLDAALEGNETLCALRRDAKLRCARVRRGGGAEPDLAVEADAERLLMLSRDKRCILRKGGTWSCYLASPSRVWSASTSASEDLQKFGLGAEPVPDSRCFITTERKLVCFDSEALSGSVVLTQVAHASVGLGIGDFAGGCAALTSGSVSCWGGMNDTGTFGDGTRGPGGPSTAKGIRDAIEVARSPDHACALTRAHAVYCWGSADGYAFGKDALANATTFRTCDRGEAGGSGNCVPGALFGGTRNHLVLTPVRVPELEGVVSLAAGFQRTCGIRTDGRVLCVGGGHPGPWTIGGGEK